MPTPDIDPIQAVIAQNPNLQGPNPSLGSVATTQTPDTPGNDENGDGVTAGQTTADNHGDILGI